MKLLCVNNKPLPNAWSSPAALAEIEEGKTYQGELCDARGLDDRWEQAWWISDVDRCYDLQRFIPVSELDETEMQRDYSTIKTLTP